MTFIRHHPWVSFVGAVVLAFAIFVGGFGFYLADEAGKLPWQEDPTRIPVEPFEGIPGFDRPTAVPTTDAVSNSAANPTTEPASNAVSEPTTVPTEEP